MATLGSTWSYLRDASTESGIFIIRQFFKHFPEEVKKFRFNLDSHGNVRPDYLFGNGMRNHGAYLMNTLDAGKTKRNPGVR